MESSTGRIERSGNEVCIWILEPTESTMTPFRVKESLVTIRLHGDWRLSYLLAISRSSRIVKGFLSSFSFPWLFPLIGGLAFVAKHVQPLEDRVINCFHSSLLLFTRYKSEECWHNAQILANLINCRLWKFMLVPSGLLIRSAAYSVSRRNQSARSLLLYTCLSIKRYIHTSCICRVSNSASSFKFPDEGHSLCW
jgi:hypothetical protein